MLWRRMRVSGPGSVLVSDMTSGPRCRLHRYSKLRSQQTRCGNGRHFHCIGCCRQQTIGMCTGYQHLNATLPHLTTACRRTGVSGSLSDTAWGMASGSLSLESVLEWEQPRVASVLVCHHPMYRLRKHSKLHLQRIRCGSMCHAACKLRGWLQTRCK